MFDTNYYFLMFSILKQFFLETWFVIKPYERPVAPPPPSFKDGFKWHASFSFAVTNTAC